MIDLSQKKDSEVILMVEELSQYIPEVQQLILNEFKIRSIKLEKYKDDIINHYRAKCRKSVEVSGFSSAKVEIPHSHLLKEDEKLALFQYELDDFLLRRSDMNRNLKDYR